MILCALIGLTRGVKTIFSADQGVILGAGAVFAAEFVARIQNIKALIGKRGKGGLTCFDITHLLQDRQRHAAALSARSRMDRADQDISGIYSGVNFG